MFMDFSVPVPQAMMGIDDLCAFQLLKTTGRLEQAGDRVEANDPTCLAYTRRMTDGEAILTS